jgi:hypothetical protein
MKLLDEVFIYANHKTALVDDHERTRLAESSVVIRRFSIEDRECVLPDLRGQTAATQEQQEGR